MSLENQVRELFERARERDEKRHAFLRHLLLLTSGALTLLVSLGPIARSSGSELARVSLQAAWPLLGLSILFLSVALHGEVSISAALVKRLAEDIRSKPGVPVPSVVKPRAIYAAAERAAYVALALSVLALVLHGVSR